MRKNESMEVEKNLGDIPNFKLIDATQKFIGRLEDVFEPEEKRKIIGNSFIDVANEEIQNLGLTDWLLVFNIIANFIKSKSFCGKYFFLCYTAACRCVLVNIELTIMIM